MSYKRKFVSVAMIAALSGGIGVADMVVLPAMSASAVETGTVSENGINANVVSSGSFKTVIGFATSDGSMNNSGWNIKCDSYVGDDVSQASSCSPWNPGLDGWSGPDGSGSVSFGGLAAGTYVYSITNKDTGLSAKLTFKVFDTFSVSAVTQNMAAEYTVLDITDKDGIVPEGGYQVLDENGNVLTTVKTDLHKVIIPNLKANTVYQFNVKNVDTGETYNIQTGTGYSFDLYRENLPDNTSIKFKWAMNNAAKNPDEWKLTVSTYNTGSKVEIYNNTLPGSTMETVLNNLTPGFTYYSELTRLDTGESVSYMNFTVPAQQQVSLTDYQVSDDGKSVTLNWDKTGIDPDYFEVGTGRDVDLSHAYDPIYNTSTRVNKDNTSFVVNNVDPTAWTQISLTWFNSSQPSSSRVETKIIVIPPTQGFTAKVDKVTDTDAAIGVNTTVQPSLWIVRNLANDKVQYVDGSQTVLPVQGLEPETSYKLAVSSADTSETKVLDVTTVAATPEPTVIPDTDIQDVTVVDEPGVANDKVTAPADTDAIDYSLVYDNATGEYTLTATAKDGYVFSDGSTVQTISGTLDTTVPTPEPTVIPNENIATPTVTDKPGFVNDSVVAPADTDQIDYELTYNNATGEWSMTATAKDGYVFEGGSTVQTTTGKLDVTPVTDPTPTDTVVPLTDVAAPTIVDEPGVADDTVTAPADTDQIAYKLTYDNATGDWVLLATAKDGYVFAGGEKTYSQAGKLDVTPAVDPTPTDTVIPLTDVAKPTITDKDGTANDAVVAPADTAQIKYDLTYDRATGTYSLTATAQDGFVFPGGKKTYVQIGTLDTSVDPTPQPKVVKIDSIAKPVIVDKPGSADDSVKAPADTDAVNYTLVYDQKTGKYTLTATAKDGYVFEGGATTFVQSGTLDVTPVAVEPKVVTAADATITDKTGWLNDSVVAPKDTDQITYALDYDKKTGKYTLTATTKPGYVFAGGGTTLKVSGQLNADPEVITAAKPVIVDKDGWRSDSVTAPANNARLTYKLAYNKQTGVWTMTATAADGYAFADGKTTNVQRGQLNVTAVATPPADGGDTSNPPIPEIIQTGQVSDDADNGVQTGLWASLTGLVGLVGGFLVGRNRTRQNG